MKRKKPPEEEAPQPDLETPGVIRVKEMLARMKEKERLEQMAERLAAQGRGPKA